MRNIRNIARSSTGGISSSAYVGVIPVVAVLARQPKKDPKLTNFKPGTEGKVKLRPGRERVEDSDDEAFNYSQAVRPGDEDPDMLHSEKTVSEWSH